MQQFCGWVEKVGLQSIWKYTCCTGSDYLQIVKLIAEKSASCQDLTSEACRIIVPEAWFCPQDTWLEFSFERTSRVLCLCYTACLFFPWQWHVEVPVEVPHLLKAQIPWPQEGAFLELLAGQLATFHSHLKSSPLGLIVSEISMVNWWGLPLIQACCFLLCFPLLCSMYFVSALQGCMAQLCLPRAGNSRHYFLLSLSPYVGKPKGALWPQWASLALLIKMVFLSLRRTLHLCYLWSKSFCCRVPTMVSHMLWNRWLILRWYLRIQYVVRG